MISNVFLAGELGDVFVTQEGENFRYVRLSANNSLVVGRTMKEEYLIPVTAFGSPFSSFYTLKKGSYVVLRGWLETRNDIGVVVVSELEDLFPKEKENK